MKPFCEENVLEGITSKVAPFVLRIVLFLALILVVYVNGFAQITVEEIIRVSVDSNGTQANSSNISGSIHPSISADGRYVVFESYADNLVVGDTNEDLDVFIHDIQTGVTTRVSVDSRTDGTNLSKNTISANGRFVAFESSASNLVEGVNYFGNEVFVHDTQTSVNSLISVGSSGMDGNDASFLPSISADGQYVAFQSSASNLVDGDTNEETDVFVHDTQSGTTTRVSVDSSGTQGNSNSVNPSISADGRYVVFESDADNLVEGDTNEEIDVFIHDTQTGTTSRVSVDSSGIEGSNYSEGSSISADGRFVAFASLASNLVEGDTNFSFDVFVRDTQTGITTRVSVDSSGMEGRSSSSLPIISADGRFVAFTSSANNLVESDNNFRSDVFMHDTQTGVTIRVSVDSNGTEGNDSSSSVYAPSISMDGQFVVFTSLASNLVEGDTNGVRDVFVVKLSHEQNSEIYNYELY